MTDLLRVVFDCNILLQAAAREKSVAAKCLNLVESGLIQICVSWKVLAEVEDVLNRPESRVPQTFAETLPAHPARSQEIQLSPR